MKIKIKFDEHNLYKYEIGAKMDEKQMKDITLPDQRKSELTASEALYGFVGWLSGQDEVHIISAKHDCAIWAELINTFCIMNNLSEPEGRWDKKLIHPEKKGLTEMIKEYVWPDNKQADKVFLEAMNALTEGLNKNRIKNK